VRATGQATDIVIADRRLLQDRANYEENGKRGGQSKTRKKEQPTGRNEEVGKNCKEEAGTFIHQQTENDICQIKKKRKELAGRRSADPQSARKL